MKAAASILALWAAAAADYSPLSMHPEGLGIALSSMGARERGMGDAGMAALNGRGYFLPNASRTAYFDRTVFTATLESDLVWLRDDAVSNRMLSYAVPSLATTIKTRRFGAFGLRYQQTHARRFNLFVPSGENAGVEETFGAEGSQNLLGFSWAYAPIPLLAIGISQDFVLGRDRFLHTAVFRDGIPPENRRLEGDTLEVRNRGSFPTLSLTVNTRILDAAVAYSPSHTLESARQRRITGLATDPLPDTSKSIPMAVATGIAWRAFPRHTLALDFYAQDWENSGPLNPSVKTALGWEFTGSDNPFEKFRKRLTYRAGIGHEILYLQETSEIYGTAGLGLPLGPRGHGLDIAIRYGHRSLGGNTFFAEDYLKISASMVGVGIWGQPIRKRK